MTAGTIIVSLILLFIVGLAVRTVIRDRKKGKCACGGQCHSCPMHGTCHKG